MNTIAIERVVRIPRTVSDHRSFRRWLRAYDLPQGSRVSFLNGEIWIDMSPEDLYAHNQVKGEFAAALIMFLKGARLGRYCSDGMLVSDEGAGLTTTPDGLFVSWKSLKSGRVKQVKGVEGIVELEGAPDFVLEVVSRSSVRKDNLVLRDLYWRAGVKEYWLVDARTDRLEFDILRHGRKGYTKAPKRSGWVPSKVLGKSFKLVRRKDALGNPEYELLVR